MLENRHIACLYSLLLAKPQVDIFARLDAAQWKEVRSLHALRMSRLGVHPPSYLCEEGLAPCPQLGSRVYPRCPHHRRVALCEPRANLAAQPAAARLMPSAQVRKAVIGAILSTDMVHHFPMVSRLEVRRHCSAKKRAPNPPPASTPLLPAHHHTTTTTNTTHSRKALTFRPPDPHACTCRGAGSLAPFALRKSAAGRLACSNAPPRPAS